jgi:hypothetical protein
MKRWLVTWLLPLVVVPGCIDRQRVNANCEWAGDSSFPMALENPAHQQHLINDAQLAEELAIRHADREHQRLFGTEAHGGLLEQGRFRDRCMSRMVDAIQTSHHVTAEQVQAARGRRSFRFDLTAGLLFLPLYSFGAAMTCRWLFRRFSSDARHARLVATGLASVAVSILGLQLGVLWLSVWEVGRVGNGHISSFRMATSHRWSQQHVGALFLAGIVLFWLIASWSRRPSRLVRGPG